MGRLPRLHLRTNEQCLIMAEAVCKQEGYSLKTAYNNFILEIGCRQAMHLSQGLNISSDLIAIFWLRGWLGDHCSDGFAQAKALGVLFQPVRELIDR